MTYEDLMDRWGSATAALQIIAGMECETAGKNTGNPHTARCSDFRPELPGTWCASCVAKAAIAPRAAPRDEGKAECKPDPAAPDPASGPASPPSPVDAPGSATNSSNEEGA